MPAGASGLFDAVVAAIPAPQALTLLAPYSRAFRHLTGVVFAPCWSAMLAFDPRPAGPETSVGGRSGPLGFAAREGSSPGRTSSPHSWVLHASAEWSRAHLELDARDAAQLMLKRSPRRSTARCRRRSPAGAPLAARAGRAGTRLALPGRPGIAAGACGDWCIAPRVEAAFESGRALAHSLLSIVGKRAARRARRPAAVARWTRRAACGSSMRTRTPSWATNSYTPQRASATSSGRIS